MGSVTYGTEQMFKENSRYFTSRTFDMVCHCTISSVGL